MPQTKQKPAQPVAVDRKPKRRYAYQLPASIAAAVRGGTRERLKELLDEFQQKGWPEEHRFSSASSKTGKTARAVISAARTISKCRCIMP